MSASTRSDFNLSVQDGSIESTVQSLIEIVEQQSKRIDHLEEENSHLHDRVDDLEENIADIRAHNEKQSKRQAKLIKRVSDVEEDVSGNPEGRVRAEETTVQQAESPLEDVVQLPEQLAEDNLTANQERARFIAMDVADYTRSVPAGRAIKSSEVRRVLTAKEDGTVHTQTVSRVIEQLAALGKDDVRIKETRAGERTVVFSNDIATRLVQQNQSHGVVISAEA